jgi:hypothetical protein
MLRGLGLCFVAYGAAGVVILIVGVLSVSRPLDEVRSLTRTLEEQRAGLVTSLDATARTLDDAAGGVDGMDDSLTQARAATDRAAGLANDVSFTMGQLAGAMHIEILGNRPLEALSSNFSRAAGQLAALASDLGAIGTALSQNEADVRVVSEDLRTLRDSVDELADLVEGGPRLEVSATAIDTIRLVVAALFIWLLTLAVASIVFGVALWRRASTPS